MTDLAESLISCLIVPKILPKHLCEILALGATPPAPAPPAGYSPGHGNEDAYGEDEDAHGKEHPCAATNEDEQGDHPTKAKQACLVSTPFSLKRGIKPPSNRKRDPNCHNQ